MYKLNQTSAFEPAPAWDCAHKWGLIGPPVKMWASNNTGGAPPEDAPVYQKRWCLVCGGVEWAYIP